MGLDVYVGTLTRYYTREWETVLQHATPESGMELQVERLNDPPDAVRDPVEIEAAVETWRGGLNASLQGHLAEPLDWGEGMAAPYFTDKPAWDCYSALLVWAAHEEHPDTPLPAVAPDDWTADGAVQRSQADGFDSRYGQLLYEPELWLPGGFTFTFRACDLAGTTIGMGSTRALHAQLHELNRRTWRADPATIARWHHAGAPHGAPLEASARFGFAVLMHLAQAAVDNRLPMKLDY